MPATDDAERRGARRRRSSPSSVGRSRSLCRRGCRTRGSPPQGSTGRTSLCRPRPIVSSTPSAVSPPSDSRCERDHPAQAGRRRACDEVDEFATRVGSVNTLVIHDGRIAGLEHRRDGRVVAGRGQPTSDVSCWDGAAQRWPWPARSRTRAPPRRPRVAAATRTGHPTVGVRRARQRDAVKDEVVVAPAADQQVVDLAYLPDGRETASSQPRARSVADGRERPRHPARRREPRRSSAGRASRRRVTSMRAALDAATADPSRSARMAVGDVAISCRTLS